MITPSNATRNLPCRFACVVIVTSFCFILTSCKPAKDSALSGSTDSQKSVCDEATVSVMKQPFESIDRVYLCSSYAAYADQAVAPSAGFTRRVQRTLEACIVKYTDTDGVVRAYVSDRSNGHQATLAFDGALVIEGSGFSYKTESKPALAKQEVEDISAALFAYPRPGGYDALLSVDFGWAGRSKGKYYAYSARCSGESP